MRKDCMSNVLSSRIHQRIEHMLQVSGGITITYLSSKVNFKTMFFYDHIKKSNNSFRMISRRIQEALAIQGTTSIVQLPQNKYT